MDALSHILRSARLNARVFLHSNFCGRWVVDTSGTNEATFHVIAGGACWLHMSDQDEALFLRAGDLVVFPHDAQHLISDSAVPPGSEVPRNRPAQDTDSGPMTSLVCGYFEFAASQWSPFMDALPDVMVIRSEDMTNTSLMDSLINFIIFEAESNQPGGDVVIDRLSDVLFIHVVRTYMQQHQPDKGYIAALVDAKISRALSQLHAHPEKSWSVERLAHHAGMSRSAFAKRFHILTELTPMQYVTRWRMQLAHELFTSTKQSTAMIAEQCGYKSEAAFSKVVKKYFGKGPGALRRESGRRIKREV